VNRTLIVPEFDPALQPIGCTLALEFLEVGAFKDSSERMLAPATAASGRFGWEFDTAA
jgi:hypothetical protein